MASDDQIKGQSNFDTHVGTEWIKLDPDDARARVELRDELRQPYGLLHGGVYSTLIESLCSYATAAAVYEQGMIAVGQSIEVSFLRPVTAGHAEARAVARHRGRSTWVWQVEIVDDEERLCALAKMTMAVRPAPG
ncbi:MAG TPA: PaaI family thioesterase [Solirubrobacterales bacterium]|nr:PaaI family thioesterase [Solirubrobacterales bacterium]